MATTPSISWYRTPIDGETLRALTRKSDLRGLLHAGGFLLIYLGTIALALLFFLRRQWVPMVLASYLHCMFHGFVGMGAAVHELSHQTAFRTKWLNDLFYRLFAFLSWNSHFHFRESHRRHHLNTGFLELDNEIQPEPIAFTKAQVAGWFLFDWSLFAKIMWTNLNHAFGNTDVDYFFWCPLLPREHVKTKQLIRWARLLFVGHGLLLALFIVFKLWILIALVTFGYFFATFLVHGCEIQQHAGLSKNVPDWRVIAYTAEFGPVMRFLYWNMNYHVEHHMYASVPFYNLPRLHRVLEPDLPKPLRGYLRGVAHVLRQKRLQNVDPAHRFMPEFPHTAHPPKITT